MIIFRSKLAKCSHLKAFAAFFPVGALICIPMANGEIAKQNMTATLPDRLLLYAVFGIIFGGIATFFYWWHGGSRKGLITGLVVILAFAFFGWRGSVH